MSISSTTHAARAGCGNAGLGRAFSLLAALLLAMSSRAASLPSGFIEENIGGTWNEAVGVAFAPDGRMFVWERGGTVWTVENGVKSTTPFIDITEEVAVWNNYGLLGFCLHPDFYNNGYVYLLYVADRHHVRFFGTPGYDPEETETHVATVGRITRYTARASDGFRSIDPASRLVLVGQTLTNGFPLVSGQHGVGTILFGSDGTLLASCGDGASSSITDIGNGSGTYYSQAMADGIIRPAENVGAYRCQMVNSLGGKIIRIDPATGDGLPSNPFYDSAAPRAPKSRVWALGLKTPSRMVLRPDTGEHNPALGKPGSIYIGDVGWNDWEDLNVCNRPGMNFGWPAFEGIDIQPDYYNSNVQNLDAPNPLQGSNGCNRPYFYFRELIKQDTLGTPSWPNPCNAAVQIPTSTPRFLHARPVIDWAHGDGPARVATFTGTNATAINVGANGSPVAGPQFGGACSMAGVWYTGTDFPAAYRNTYFHADYEAQWIKNFVFDTNDSPVEVRNFASGAGGVVFVTTHPIDGGLYYITWDSTLRRIRYVAGGNQPPAAVASLDRRYGPGPLAVQFTGANSIDPEGLPLAYEWNFGDGSPANTNVNPAHVFNPPTSAPTRYDVTLKVTDRSGATNSTSLLVSANNTPPLATILTPTNGTRYAMTGDTVHACSALVSDAEHDNDLLRYAWQTVLHHNNHIHSEPVNTNQSMTVILSPEGCDGQTYFYRIVLTVTDPAGLSATNEVRLHPDCPTNTPPPPPPPPPPPTTNTTNTTSSSGLDPSLPPAGNFDLSHWYLGTPAQPQSTSVSVADLLAGFTNSWFYTGTNGAMVFWCPVNGGTTSGSSYPRSELREQINPPDNTVNWTASGTHILDAKCKVTQQPSTGKIVIGQIHSYLGDAYPLVKLVFDNGRIDAQVKESATESTDLHYYFPNVPLNSVITYRIHYQDGILTLTINGVTQTIDTFDNDPEWADQTFYFKAGSYVQDNSGTSAEGGRVEFYELRASHTNFPPAPLVITKQPASQSVPLGSNSVINLSVVGGLPISYQWFEEGILIPGATNSILPIRNVQSGDAADYHAIAFNAAGSVTSAVSSLTVLGGTPLISLAEGLDTTNLVWTTSGDAPWEGHYGVAHDGLDQARSGIIADEEISSMQTTVVGPGSISFWWKVSSQTNDDFLVFYIGSSQQASLSGSVDWQQRTFTVPAGTQTLRWSYEKGEELSASSDRGWVDEVRFGPQPVAITAQPTNRVVDAGTTVTLAVTATGTPPLSYRWHCNGAPLSDGAGVRGTGTNSLVLSNVPVALAGTYFVVVSNAAGPVTSSNALLSVTPVVTLAEALDGSNLVWTTNGTPPWTGQAVVMHDGVDAARSGAIGHSASAYFQTTVAGPGTISFWWKVSSQTNSDLLRFYVGSTERARISGEVDWRSTNFSIASGNQTLRWTYSKNGSTVVGQDRAWVDEIFYDKLQPPAPPEGLTANPISISRIDLAWSDIATNESGYLVERSTNSATTFTQIASLGSNVTTFASTGLLANSIYLYRVRAVNAAGNSAYSGSVTSSTLPFTSAKINFQPASAAVPPGYFVDGGSAFGSRGNGLAYGWNSSRTSSATDRNSTLSPDQRHDTFISSSTSTSTRWELAVPNDTYNVFIVAGDAGSSSGTYRFSVEGVAAINGSVSSSNRWLSRRLNVAVTDGRLSVSNLAGASNNKICFLDIAKVTQLLTCQPNKTVACGSPWDFDAPETMIDPCSGSNVTVLVASTVTNSATACSLTVTRTWTAIDACGNTNICSQKVTVTDKVPPPLACAEDKVVECGTDWSFDEPTVFPDACSGTNVALVVVSTATNVTGFCGGTLAVTRTWSATDPCGNFSECSQTVTLVDTTAPALLRAPDKIVECGEAWYFDSPVVSPDACSGTKVSLAIVGTVTNAAGFCQGTFTATRTWSATDDCGNSNTCSQTVTIVDLTAPALTCAADKTVECGATWDFDEPKVIPDNCAFTNVALAVFSTETNNSCGTTFAATRIWSATDLCGNASYCTQIVAIVDATPPVIACLPGRTVEFGVAWDFDEPSASDACSGTNVTAAILGTMTNVLCDTTFSVTRAWSVTDLCGNSNTCSQTVMITDTTPPSVSCAGARFIEAGADWTFDEPMLADGSDTNLVLSVVSTMTNGLCGSTFSATRTWSVADACGNSNSCSQTVTVIDSLAPSVVCPSDSVVEFGVEWAFAIPAGTDIADGTNVTISVLSTVTNALCGAAFTVTRVWSATDACGNSNTCSQAVAVLDTTAPAVTCGPARLVELGTAWAFDEPEANDLGDGTNVAIVIIATTTNGLCGATFSASRTWSATDGCGNSNVCSQTITFVDTTAPSLVCGPARMVEWGPAWEFDPPVAVDSDGSTNLIVSIVSTTTNLLCGPGFIATRTWGVMDACGNSNACSHAVTVEDTTAPVVDCPPAMTVELGTDWAFASPTASDLGDGANVSVIVVSTVTNVTCGAAYEVIRTWAAVDACGNSNGCSQTVTVLDTTAPVFSCAPMRTVECGSAWNFDPPTANDFGDGTNVVIAVILTSTNTSCVGTFSATRTWSATDACGNSNTCSQTIEVADTTAPAILCEDVMTCDPGVSVTPLVSDACDPAPQLACARSDGQALAAVFPVGVTTLDCSAADACGNTNTCVFRITVLAPLAASGPADQSVIVGSDVVFVTAASGAGPLSYAWRFNGEIIAGAATNFLVLQNVPADSAGSYCVEITGPCTSITNCAALSVLDARLELCAMTQGFYADTNTQVAGMPLLTALTNLLEPGPVTLGKPGARSTIITAEDAESLATRLPARGLPTALPDQSGLPFADLPLTPKGRLDNALVGQMLALTLNCRLEPVLTNFPIATSFCTRGPEGVRAFSVPEPVLAALMDPALAISNTTVVGLQELANCALAGLPTAGASLLEIHDAVESINAGFDSCRTLVTCSLLTSLAPANDHFEQRQLLAGNPPTNGVRVISSRNAFASAEAGEPEHASVIGGRSLWWQWTPERSGTVRIRTRGSSFDTLLAVYTGSTLAQLTPVAANDDHEGNVWSEITFEAVAGVTYQIAVDGYASDSGNVVLAIVESPAP